MTHTLYPKEYNIILKTIIIMYLNMININNMEYW